jgi:hypothetical protein
MAKDKIKSQVSTPDSYKLYKKSTTYPVPPKVYVTIVNEFFKFLIKQVIEGTHIKLPARLGSILVRGTKIKPRIENGQIKGASPDWAKTKELWDSNPEAKAQKKTIYCLNEHTNGVRYRIAWSKLEAVMENKSLYSLVFSRLNKRTVYRNIIAGKEYYVQN